MSSIKAPGGAYHYRRHKRWGAREEARWRQSVKDHGCAQYQQRRRKASIKVIENSEEVPCGWDNITVGERWNGRGEAVDEFLADLAASPLERREAWEYLQPDGIAVFETVLQERRVVKRAWLQYHVEIRLTIQGELANNFHVLFRKHAPYYDSVNNCMTEKSREETWRTLFLACASVASELRVQILNWENRVETALVSLQVYAPRDGREETIYTVRSGQWNDYMNRFSIAWSMSAPMLEEITVTIGFFPAPAPTLASPSAILFYATVKANDVITIANGIGNFLDNLPTAAPIKQTGARIISDE